MGRLINIIKGKAFIYVALFVGCISLLFIGQENQYGIFAWIAPIFLLHFSRRAKPIRFVFLFLLLIMTGFITQKSHNLFNDPVIGAINGVSYAFITMIIYVIDRMLFVKGKRLVHTLVFPSVYVVIEALVTSKIGTSGVLAQSQFSFTPFAQLSTITGLHGITFIICWFASVLYWFFENDFKSTFVKNGLLTFGSVFILIISYGFIKTASQAEAQKTVRVATISGPFDLHRLAQREKDVLLRLGKQPNMKIPASFFSGEKDISVQIKNTRNAAELGAKIIVWSEASLFLNQNQLNSIITEVKNISKAFNTYVLLAFFEERSSDAPKPINNKSILIGKDGTIVWEYKKAHPTPSEIPVVNSGNSEIPVVDTQYGRLGNVICYDYDFPSFLAQANRKNVDIMLVPAYDWKEFASMHSKMAQFETLQSGRLLIRSNGNGINMVSNDQGKIIAELNTFNNTNKILYANLPLNSSPTVYAETANAFVMFCFICFVLSIVLKITLLFKLKRMSN
ncbi:nitrilase-related carbon-nitrogen hydrolase [Roseimarinus sediminis]|uniref:nitrilase-related carbon-nitrogen hydrolase n=1 Tax=Roseimarinus sediminis TaxID=1610899 RepID=UPI003D19FB08